MSKITSRYTTVATVGYTGAVSRTQNRAAHGGVCHLQVRKVNGRVIGRKVNSNGRHEEIGEPFDLTAEQLAHWETIARSSR
jgi:hypothetical protein